MVYSGYFDRVNIKRHMWLRGGLNNKTLFELQTIFPNWKVKNKTSIKQIIGSTQYFQFIMFLFLFMVNLLVWLKFFCNLTSQFKQLWTMCSSFTVSKPKQSAKKIL